MSEITSQQLMNVLKVGKPMLVMKSSARPTHEVQTHVKKQIFDDNDEALPCDQCPKTFGNTNALRNHQRLQHNMIFLDPGPLEYQPFPKLTKSGHTIQHMSNTVVKVQTERPMQSKINSTAMKIGPKIVHLTSPIKSGNILRLNSPVVIKQSQIKVEPEDSSEEEPKPKKTLIKLKDNDLLSRLKPQSLVSLASEDVSYIIVKSEDVPKKRKRNIESDSLKRAYTKPSKEPHNMTGPFECLQPSTAASGGLCHQIFFNCCEYSVHFRDEHTKRRKSAMRCQVCEKRLEDGAPEAAFTCQTCGYGFDTQAAFDEHSKTAHVRLKPYQCGICNKRFTQQGGVVQHMRMHTGDRPFPCSFCSKAFTQKSGLEQHLRTHTKIKPYRCVICSKTFAQSVHLKQHMRTHTNIQPFECEICRRKFKQASHLNFHYKSHTDKKETTTLNYVQGETQVQECPDQEIVDAVQEISEENEYMQVEEGNNYVYEVVDNEQNENYEQQECEQYEQQEGEEYEQHEEEQYEEQEESEQYEQQDGEQVEDEYEQYEEEAVEDDDEQDEELLST